MRFTELLTEEDAGKVSAGILLFSQEPDLKVFLAHLGGPKYEGKNSGAWGIPKGNVEAGEDLTACAHREFEEETGIELDYEKPMADLGSSKTSRGKLVRIFAYRGTGREQFVSSNTFEMEWPEGSGNKIEVPENDSGRWFTLSDARKVIMNSQKEFLYTLEDLAKFS